MMGVPRIPAWQLERHRLGELPSHQAASIAETLAGDAEARAHIDELQADDARVLAAHPPRVMAAAIGERIDRESKAPSPSRARVRLLGAAAAAVCLLAVVPLVRPRSPLPETRIKGLAPSLLVFRESANRPEPLASSSFARADDVIQLAYQAAGRRYGVVISIDGRGHVTRHLPKTGDRAARLESGAPVPLAEAYRLDDAPGFELFFLVAADAPFSVEAVVREAERQYSGGTGLARAGIRLDLAANLDQFRFELRKEGSR
jgi:hypothetical protein